MPLDLKRVKLYSFISKKTVCGPNLLYCRTEFKKRLFFHIYRGAKGALKLKQTVA